MPRAISQTRSRDGAGVIAMATVGGLILAVDLSVVGFFALVQTGLIILQ